MYTHICTMLVALSLLLPIVGAQELSDDDKRTVQQFIKDAWNEIGATGGTTKLRAGFDETNFVDYSVSGLAAGGLPAKDLAGLKKGIRKGLKSMIGKLMGTIGKTWTKGFYEVRPVKLERGDAICQVVVFEFGEEAINLFDFKLRRRGGEWKWIDLRDATNGTWMKTRMMGAIGLLVAKKITFADFAGYRAFGVAMGMGKHAEARAAYKRMAPALQDHLAVLPMARMCANELKDMAWATSLRDTYVKNVGVDDALLFTDIDYYIYLGKPAKSLESINKLAEKYGDSGLLWYKTAMVAAVGKDWQAVIDASIKAVKHGADFYPSHIGLISGYAQTKAYDKAVVAAKAAQAKFPQVQFDYTDKELFGDFAQSKEYKEAFAGR